MKISLILPTAHRPNKLLRTLKNIHDTTDPSNIETIVIVDQEDLETKLILKGISSLPMNPSKWIVAEGSPTGIQKWNLGAKLSSYPWLMLHSDDVLMPVDWYEKVKNTVNHGFIALPDQFSNKAFEPFYLAHREWLKDHQGGVFCVPHYHSWGIDLEICARAKALGHYVVANTSFQHLHHLFSREVKLDSTYQRAQKYQREDIELFNRRKLAGFPNDFKSYL